jgi:hypothetical protein
MSRPPNGAERPERCQVRRKSLPHCAHADARTRQKQFDPSAKTYYLDTSTLSHAHSAAAGVPGVPAEPELRTETSFVNLGEGSDSGATARSARKFSRERAAGVAKART